MPTCLTGKRKARRWSAKRKGGHRRPQHPDGKRSSHNPPIQPWRRSSTKRLLRALVFFVVMRALRPFFVCARMASITSPQRVRIS